MTLWFKRTATCGFRPALVDLDREPAPAIMAGGVDGGNTSQYWIEDDGQPVTAAGDAKPPYRVPTMAEIAAIPWNGFNVVSTFAGCGGSSLGYRMAGFRVLWASEFIDAARASYEANKAPATIVDGRDIRLVTPAEIMAATGLAIGELDVLDGSPPCASFSTAGRRQDGWGAEKKYSDKVQRVDDLFFEYVRLVDGLRPKVFVAENVSGLVKGVAKGYFLKILAALKAAGDGYRVEARVLDAQWLGVPQQRQRVIFVGVRSDLPAEPKFPSPLPYRYSVRDAIPWLGGSIAYRGQPGGQEWQDRERSIDEPSAAVSADGYGGAARHQAGIVEPESDISRFAIGAEADRLHPGQQSDRFMSLVRADPAEPCPTVTATGATLSAACVIHPTEKRKFSIAELRRICAFPDDFVLTGTYAQQWERLGRAVPPVMMYAIATAVREGVLDHVRHFRDVPAPRTGRRKRT